jgi:hypothetical protein
LKIRKAHCGQDPMGNSVDTKGAIFHYTWSGPAGFIHDRIVPMSVNHRLLSMVSGWEVVRSPNQCLRVL